MRLSWALSFALLVAWSPAARAGAEARAQADELEGRRLIHLLGYVAADYPKAVEGGQIKNRFEHEEQLTLLDDAARAAALLSREHEAARGLAQAIGALREKVKGAASAREVAQKARALERAVAGALKLDLVPPERPSPTRGRALFVELCAVCHGTRGRADTPRARELKPPPADFVDPIVAEALSPARVAQTVRFGIPGTAMAEFPTLAERDLWDLGFYVLSLRHTARSAVRTPRYSLADLATRTDGELLDALYAAGAEKHELGNMLAELRTRAAFGEPGDRMVFAEARGILARAGQHLWWGERAEAGALLQKAQQGAFGEGRAAAGFFLPGLGAELDERLLALRGRARAGEAVEFLDRDLEVIGRKLTEAELMVAGLPPPGDPLSGVTTEAPHRTVRQLGEMGARAGLRLGWSAAVGWLALGAMRFWGQWEKRGLRLGLWALGVLVLVAWPLLEVASFARAPIGAEERPLVWGLWGEIIVMGVISTGLAYKARSLPRAWIVRGGLVICALLSIVRAGVAAHALELAGVLPHLPLGWIGIPELGLYPSVLGCVAQLGVGAMALGLLLRARVR